MPRRFHRISCDALHRLIENSFRDFACVGGGVSVDGKISRLGHGLWHDNYWFWISGKNVPAERTERAYVLRLLAQTYEWQKGPQPLERLLRESETLFALREAEFGYPTPEFIGFVRDDSQTIGMIETAIPGVSLESFKDETTLRVVGRVAAAIHRLDHQRFGHVPNSSDRAQHVLQRLDEIATGVFDQFPVAQEAREWIIAHRPPSDPPCLLHGDLLPQNLVFELTDGRREEARVGIVDWEMACIGDPAYDLAIVSRANRKVLGVNNGLKLLLQSYRDAGGRPISLQNVRVHEVLLVLDWLQESWLEHQKPERNGQGPEYYEEQLRSLLRRAATEA